ncbi:MAG: translation initiation factor IF-5A [Candidatus Iainarchaeum archaeon]|uniref:Translation initiation factor 5A n=1 Tax=Candidatus Iainarchaeum sp. TaxID=3101447 RepID=A0A7T9DJN1_9ARCH|nr:MAG: translation initiation factor IF-5A [Candidatus Diapherotrites archaeon]
MEIKFTKTGQLREGGYVMVDGFVCQIKSIEKSKPGKHGSAKARITATGVFDNQKRTLMQPTSADAEVPMVERGNAQVVAVMGGQLQIMDVTSYETFNVAKPAELKDLKSGDEVEYLRAETQFRILRKKNA